MFTICKHYNIINMKAPEIWKKAMSKSTAGYPKAYKALESLLQGIWDVTG
jgi:hypothetical protein